MSGLLPGDILPTASAILGSKVAYLSADEDDLPDVPAVENGGTPNAKINYLSVSQLKKAAPWVEGGCLRKWRLSKVEHLEEPERASTKLGKEVHAQLEHYLKFGEDVLGDIARAALPYLPEPKSPGLQLEQSITKSNNPISGATLEADGIPLVGFIDREDWSRQDVGVVKVTDYKTSSNPEKYAASEDDLATTSTAAGIQMVGYAVSVLNRRPDVARVDLEHLYLHTKPTKADKSAKRDAKPVEASITAARARAEWSPRMDALARTLRQVAKAPSAADVEPNFEACGAFGGCPFYGPCLLLESRKTPAVPQPERQNMSLKDLLAKKAANAAPPAPAAPPAATEPVPEIVPPDAPASKPELAAEQPPAPPAPPPAASAAAGEPEKPKRGRKPKAQTSTDAPASVLGAVAPPEEHNVPPPLTIFYNAVPSAPVASLTPYVKARLDEMLRAFPDCVDIRCAPKKTAEGKDHPLAFGAWKGVLSAACKCAPPEPSTYMAIGDDEITAVVVEALAPLCPTGHFIRGVR